MLKSLNLFNLMPSNVDFYLDHAYPYWQKYVNGVNMTQIDCDLREDKKCLNRKSNDELYTVTNIDDVSSMYSLTKRFEFAK